MSARVLFAVLLTAGSMLAQSITSTIVGSVKDPSGLGVPNAKATLTEIATGAQRTAKADQLGNFVFSTLPVGEYSLVISADGFKKLEKRGIMLSAAETRPVGDLMLTIGTAAETITVSAQGSVVQTASSERAGTITDTQVENLLIKGRNVIDLLLLLPGVVSSTNNDTLASEMYLNVQGNRQTQNNVTMDGVVGNDQAWSLSMSMFVSMDSVAQVRVLSTNYQAENGQRSGPTIDIITKSGTRDFHGLVSYFKRNEEFNANNFFNNRNGTPKSRYRFNTWTYNVGGPIFVPGRFNRNRDKLFFFWSQEFWPVTIPNSLSQLTVPTQLERQGDFSQSLDVNGKLISITDPTTGHVFPGNVIPTSRLDPNGLALLKVLPLPNFLNTAVSRGTYNYVYQGTETDPKRTDTLKLDYNVDSNDQISVSMRTRFETDTHTNAVRTGGNAWPQLQFAYEIGAYTWAAHYQRIFSSSLVNELVLGAWTKPDWDEIAASEIKKNQASAVGFNAGQFYPQANPLGLIPNASFGGVTNAASLSAIDGRFPYWGRHVQESIDDNLTKTIRSHIVRGGVHVERDQRSSVNSITFNGSFSFARDVTNPLDTGYAFSNAALGVFDTYTQASDHPIFRAREHAVEWYLQDNWKVSKHLTLDYGLRFYWQPPWVERNNLLTDFVPQLYNAANQVRLIQPAMVNNVRVGVNPVNGQVYPAAAIGAIAPGSGNPTNGMVVAAQNAGVPPSIMRNFGLLYAPRFGFAYDPFGKGKTAVRGGFGVFYTRADIEQWNVLRAQTPLVQVPVTYYGTLSTFLSSPGLVFPQSVLGLDGSSPAQKVMNYSLGVQQDVGFGTVVDAAYVGSLGRHLPWERNLNPIPFLADFNPANADPTNPSVPLPTGFLRPMPTYGNVNFYENAGSSSYHSLQVTARRRFAHGVQFGASWTWSKAMDFVDSDTSSVSVLVSPRVWNYGLAGFDRTHTLKLDWMWAVPKVPWNNVFARTVLHNWQLSAITSFISGAPLGVGYSTTVSTDITGTSTQGARVVVTGNPILPKGQRTFGHFFNTAAFQMPAKGTWGNAGKTEIRGPGVNNWDLAVFKNFPIHEPISVQFRWEMYNAFNHTQFTGVNTTARFDPQGNQVDSTFGQFTSAGNPRIMQFALRFYF